MGAQAEDNILAAIAARRQAGIADLGADLRLRIADLGDLVLDTPARQAGFQEVFDAFTPAQFDFFAVPDECAIAIAGSTIRVSGILVDTENRQYVGPMTRTLVLDVHLASHDFMSLQQSYRNNALAPVLLNQAFSFYDLLGIVAVLVQAGLETGRWYWGRLGFEFAHASERAAAARWGRAVVRALGDPVDVSAIRDARDWALLGSTPPQIQTSFEAITQAMPRSRFQHLRGVPLGSYLRLVADQNRLRFDQDIDLGRAIMLSGPDWYGLFPLGDTARRSQLDIYMRTKLRQAAASGNP